MVPALTLPRHGLTDAAKLALEHRPAWESPATAVALELRIIAHAGAPTHQLVALRDVACKLVTLLAVVAGKAELACACARV